VPQKKLELPSAEQFKKLVQTTHLLPLYCPNVISVYG
jgi:hypothetical protein